MFGKREHGKVQEQTDSPKSESCPSKLTIGSEVYHCDLPVHSPDNAHVSKKAHAFWD